MLSFRFAEKIRHVLHYAHLRPYRIEHAMVSLFNRAQKRAQNRALCKDVVKNVSCYAEQCKPSCRELLRVNARIIALFNTKNCSRIRVYSNDLFVYKEHARYLVNGWALAFPFGDGACHGILILTG